MWRCEYLANSWSLNIILKVLPNHNSRNLKSPPRHLCKCFLAKAISKTHRCKVTCPRYIVNGLFHINETMYARYTFFKSKIISSRQIPRSFGYALQPITIYICCIMTHILHCLISYIFKLQVISLLITGYRTVPFSLVDDNPLVLLFHFVQTILESHMPLHNSNKLT